MKKLILLIAMLLISFLTFSQHRSRKSGRFVGGHGSSHRGGHYVSRKGNGDHYFHRKRK
ncbi:MAG TPA: hypothetical protein VGI43_19280 [Mucilaginibacter sp.]|jgi:hypothetical protein